MCMYLLFDRHNQISLPTKKKKKKIVLFNENRFLFSFSPKYNYIIINYILLSFYRSYFAVHNVRDIYKPHNIISTVEIEPK